MHVLNGKFPQVGQHIYTLRPLHQPICILAPIAPSYHKEPDIHDSFILKPSGKPDKSIGTFIRFNISDPYDVYDTRILLNLSLWIGMTVGHDQFCSSTELLFEQYRLSLSLCNDCISPAHSPYARGFFKPP